MKDFKIFLKKLLDNPSTKRTLVVKGKKKKIRGMARFTSVNYAGDEYIKIVFHDHSFLLILIKEQELYYSDKLLGKARGITDKMIGEDKVIKYKEKKYRLDNKDDYQYTLQLYVGTIFDIEGECRFSDYSPLEGPKEFLSLGWLSFTGKRADINPIIIDNKEVDVIN